MIRKVAHGHEGAFVLFFTFCCVASRVQIITGPPCLPWKGVGTDTWTLPKVPGPTTDDNRRIVDEGPVSYGKGALYGGKRQADYEDKNP